MVFSCCFLLFDHSISILYARKSLLLPLGWCFFSAWSMKRRVDNFQPHNEINTHLFPTGIYNFFSLSDLRFFAFDFPARGCVAVCGVHTFDMRGHNLCMLFRFGFFRSSCFYFDSIFHRQLIPIHLCAPISLHVYTCLLDIVSFTRSPSAFFMDWQNLYLVEIAAANFKWAHRLPKAI